MELAVSNYRGVASAKIDLTKMALIGGENYAGKSSVAQACAAVVTGTAIPIPGVQKQHADRLVRKGCDGGAASITCVGGATIATWPACEVKREGTNPHSSLYAAGMTSVTDLDAKAMAEEIGKIIGALPSKEDLEACLKAKGINIDIAALWQKVEGLGWDGQHKRAKEIGTKLKGQWEQVTGERFGVAKMKDWKPKGWTADLENMSHDDLWKSYEQANSGLEKAIGQGAVDQGRIENDRKIVAKLPELEAEVKKKKTYIESVDRNILDIGKALKLIPGAALKCPHCNKMVAVAGDTLEAAKDGSYTPKEYKEAVADCSKGLDEANKAKFSTMNEMSRLEGEIAAIQGSVNRIKNFKNIPAFDVEKERGKLDAAKYRLELTKSRQDAAHISKNLEVNVAIIDALSPSGVRMEKLVASLEPFNKKLLDITSNANWGNVTINEKMEVWYLGYPLELCSGSENYRAKVALQIAISQTDGSELVVIDCADILDRKGRNGLFGALVKAEMPALVCMTIDAKDKLPDIRKIGGKSYWMADNRTEELDDEDRR